MSKDLRSYYYAKLVKSLRYLEYSYQRVSKLSVKVQDLKPEELETWDGFATRFSRASDLFLSKFIKATVKYDDPAFDGSFRDHLHRAEKLKLISDLETWIDIRNLRNVVVHEYSEEDLEVIFEKMRRYAPIVLNLEKALAHAC